MWCRQHITSEEGGEEVKGKAASLLKEYVSVLSTMCTTLLREIDSLEQIPDTLPTALGKTLLGKALPEMLVLLGTVSEMEVDCMKLINSLQPLVGLLKSITCKVPNEFLTVSNCTCTHTCTIMSVMLMFLSLCIHSVGLQRFKGQWRY